MKSLLLIGLLSLLLAGCQKKLDSDSSDWTIDHGRIKILSTIAQVGDLVAEVGGERVDSLVLIRGSLNPHFYELVKGDGERIERADLIFYNGLGLEHGASLSSALRAHPNAVAVGDDLLKNHPDQVLYKGSEVDPHVWMDVSLWAYVVDCIVQKLSERDPAGASYYEERGERCREQMHKKHQELIERVHRVPAERRFLVTSHDAFHYFTRAYLSDGEETWAERFAAPEGLAPDGQLSVSDIQRIVRYVRAHHVEVLFPESNVNRDSIVKIVNAGKELGLSVRVCREPLYGDAMDGEHLTYLRMMEHNADVIARNLNA